MAYADHAFYTEKYFGTAIGPAEFPRLAELATDYLDYITQGNADQSSEKLKKACCALAEKYQIIDKANKASTSADGELSSQTVGSYSVSYRSGADAAQSASGELYGIAARYLSTTGMMSRARCGRCTPPTL